MKWRRNKATVVDDSIERRTKLLELNTNDFFSDKVRKVGMYLVAVDKVPIGGMAGYIKAVRIRCMFNAEPELVTREYHEALTEGFDIIDEENA